MTETERLCAARLLWEFEAVPVIRPVPWYKVRYLQVKWWISDNITWIFARRKPGSETE